MTSYVQLVPFASVALACLFILVLVVRSMTKRKPERTSSDALPAAPPSSGASAVDSVPASTPKLTVPPPPAPPAEMAKSLPKIGFEDDADVEPTKLGDTTAQMRSVAPTQKIVYDEDAVTDEPTHAGALILITAIAQSDRGQRRKKNEDSILAQEDEGIFVVADGMGGYEGGEIASKLAVETIGRAFTEKQFDGPQDDALPRRASELARAIQMANNAVFKRAGKDKQLAGMGTTICAARFSPNKQRLYVGHVGDSRIYCYRNSLLKQMTTDHTMKDYGIGGDAAGHLIRAVGVWPVVPIDIVLGKPQPRDIYVLCSDGLTKMVKDDVIREVIASSETPSVIVEELIRRANANGGKDNISVVVVRVDDPAKSDRPSVAA